MLIDAILQAGLPIRIAAEPANRDAIYKNRRQVMLMETCLFSGHGLR